VHLLALILALVAVVFCIWVASSCYSRLCCCVRYLINVGPTRKFDRQNVWSGSRAFFYVLFETQ
jgi:hypothetical protein